MVVTAMSENAPKLPDDPAVLRAIIASLEAENAKLSATLRAHDLLVQTLRTRIAKLQKQIFGKSSEKIEREIEQLELALEDLQVAMAEADDAAGPDDNAEDDIVTPNEAAPEEKALRRRPRISKDAPRERRELDPGDNCPDCGGDLRVLGEDVSELIDMIAAQLKVIEIARIKKSCRRCEKIVQEPAPSRPIPRSMAGPGLLAYILTSKFDDHVPLYRQHEIFERMGADIPDTTLVDWCGAAMRTLAPLIERIEADIMGSDILHAPSRQIASQSPAGQWTILQSAYSTVPPNPKGWAKVSNRGASGPTSAISVLGPGKRRRALSITSHRIERANIPASI